MQCHVKRKRKMRIICHLSDFDVTYRQSAYYTLTDEKLICHKSVNSKLA